MTSELTRITTADGHALLGAVTRAANPSGTALVLLHGLGANAFMTYTDAVAADLSANGVTVVRAGMRDSEMLRIEERLQERLVVKGGGGHHRFDDSLTDIEAWIDEAVRQGGDRVVLFGHSLGSLKATQYLGITGDRRVVGLVLASTADLVALHEARYTAGDRAAHEALAGRLVAEGRGEELMPADCTVGLLRQPVSAAAYMDRFGDPPAWDVMDLAGRGSDRAFRALGRVTAPVLAFFGTEAETVPRESLAEAFAALRTAAGSAPSFATEILEGADHFYGGMGPEVARVTLEWLRAEGLAG